MSRAAVFLTFTIWSVLGWGIDPTQTALLPEELQEVGIDQSVLGSQLTTSLKFSDEEGAAGELQSFFLKGKPSLISVVYYNCPGLCGLHMNGAATLFEDFSLTAGEDFNWITITMDGTETPDLALKKKINYIDQFEVPGAAEGWKFLTSNEETVQQITKEMGFSFKWDEKTKQFAHSAAFYVITPEGKISQIIPGIGFEEQTVRLALVQAAGGSIGTVVDQILLFCYQFDPSQNKYGLYAFNLMRIAGALTVLVLGIILIPLWKKEKSRGGNT
ncbi:MAG: SCO family protein [Bdellovibrionales bacterium]